MGGSDIRSALRVALMVAVVGGWGPVERSLVSEALWSAREAGGALTVEERAMVDAVLSAAPGELRRAVGEWFPAADGGGA
jgi:hypothetical protein